MGVVGGSKERKVPVLFIVRALECLDEIHLDLEGPSNPIREAHSLSSPVPRVPSKLTFRKSLWTACTAPLVVTGVGNET